MRGLFDFKTSQFLSKLKHTQFAPRLLILKLGQVLKFNDICVSWNDSTPKTDLETNFLNLENQSFENVSFSQC